MVINHNSQLSIKLVYRKKKITSYLELLNRIPKTINKIRTTKNIKICKIDPVSCIQKIVVKTNFGYENNS